jgi:hypothetical protein
LLKKIKKLRVTICVNGKYKNNLIVDDLQLFLKLVVNAHSPKTKISQLPSFWVLPFLRGVTGGTCQELL